MQGVFFRAETARHARQAGVCGWVRNLADGTVEAVFEGPRGAVEQMINWCRSGPPLAQVQSVQVDWQQPAGETAFSIR